MMKALKKVNWKKLGIFAGGVLFGTAGIKVLSSKDAKNVYTHCTAGVQSKGLCHEDSKYYPGELW